MPRHLNSHCRSRLIGLTTAVVGLLFSISQCLAQEGEKAETQRIEVDQDIEEAEVLPEENMVMNPFGYKDSTVLAAKRFHLNQVFQVEIELIERLCEPTEQQKAKLRVAAKGAVKKLSVEWQKKTGQRFGAVPVPAQLDDGANQDAAHDETEEQAEEEIKDASEIDDQMAHFLIMDVDGNPFSAVPPQDEKTWTSLVAAILTAEQGKTLSDYRAAEAQQKREDMLRSVLGEVTRELGLTPEQRQKLQAAFQPHFENATFKGVALYQPFMSYYYASKVKNEELATFLSPAQIQKLWIFLWPSRRIAQMMDVEE